MYKISWISDRIAKLLRKEAENVAFFKGARQALIKKFVIPLTNAGTREIQLSGNFIYAQASSSSGANCDIQFGRRDDDFEKYNFIEGFGLKHPFDKIYVSWEAQSGETITLWVGEVYPELFDIIDNRVINKLTIVDDSIYSLRQNTRSGNGDTGTQVNKSVYGSTALEVIHTVTAGKTFYLTAANLAGKGTDIGFIFSILVTNAADAIQYTLLNLVVNGDGATGDGPGGVSNNSYPTPIKIPAGYKIKLNTASMGAPSTSEVYANIQGWEE